ncbi:cache domain-containing sensor histidine kinase [Paenibacillus puerhi]|uniref:cache domain-containing sensor histidine kinase n=1 Tax=Paenibacillus puerhi TaxID=2692622 RepID=UPI001F36C316|nr:sensor histidine kinase [Paenibacillus puerhi]
MEMKLIIIFIVLIIIPISLLGYVTNKNSNKSLQDNTIAYVMEVSNEMMRRLDEYIKDMEQLSTIPAYVTEIKENLELSNGYYEAERSSRKAGAMEPSPMNPITPTSVDIRQKVEASINFLNNIKQETTSVYLFDKYGNAYYRYKNGYRTDIQTRYEQWKKAVEEQKGLPALIATEEIISNTKGRSFVFSVVREVFNDAYQSIGLIVVDANMSTIERFVSSLDKVTRGKTFIVDQHNMVIYDSDRAYIARQLPESKWLHKANGQQGSFEEEVDGVQSLVVYVALERTQWKMLITVPLKELTKDVERNQRLAFFSAILTIGVALTASIFLSFAVTRSLRKLINLMRVVQQGKLDVRYPITVDDEIGRLGNQFNRMLERIQDLIHENQLIGERKREAELDALQSQINPHFIYNTLESIRMTAEYNDDEEVADMTEILGKLLRYSISMGKEFVTLEEELDHIRNYMKLQDYRYPHQFQLIIEPYGDYRNLHLLKLVLQPIVENAIFHGQDASKPAMILRVSFQVTGSDIGILIRDNGLGMEPEVLHKLRMSLISPAAEGQQRNKRSIGLRNVNERLKLYYGEAYGLEVDSVPGEGTQVCLRVQRMEGKERLYAQDSDRG